jgi:hypothetical protein
MMPLRAKAIMRVARKKSRHSSRRILEAAPTRQVNYLRIYIIDGAYQRACVFRPMPITDSGACRSPIPADADHRFQRMPITRSG